MEALPLPVIFADLARVPQQDSPTAVVSISYAEDFVEAMDYFRAVLAKDEMSERALHLSRRVIALNAANYTAWWFRIRVLDALHKDLKPELDFITECAERSPKNYQIWNHRRAIVQRLGDASKEAEFTAGILAGDAKNYHAWSHRQWAVKHFDQWDIEMDMVEHFISKDVRNNSAWNHRWFVLTRGNVITSLPQPVLEREMNFAIGQANLALHNECPFNYMRGVATLAGEVRHEGNLAMFPKVIEWALATSRTAPPSCVALQSFCADVLEQTGNVIGALAVVTALEENNDTIRRNYWRWRKERLVV